MSNNESEKQNSLEIIHKKSNFFRTVYCNEVFGGVSLDNRIEMNFFRTGYDLPEKVFHKLNEEGKVGKEIREKRVPELDRVVRNIEVSVVMDLQGAKDLRIWLDDKIKILEGRK